MKKIFLSAILLCLLSAIFVPFLANAQIVPQDCGYTKFDPNTHKCIENCRPCNICDFFNMLTRIYDFIVKTIATPLAIIAIVVGGILMLISAGNANLLGKGKKILYAAIIGLALVYCSWIIIDVTLRAVGYLKADNWWTLELNC